VALLVASCGDDTVLVPATPPVRSDAARADTGPADAAVDAGPACPTCMDVLFIVDTSGSMKQELDSVLSALARYAVPGRSYFAQYEQPEYVYTWIVDEVPTTPFRPECLRVVVTFTDETQAEQSQPLPDPASAAVAALRAANATAITYAHECADYDVLGACYPLADIDLTRDLPEVCE
jgi:hypothetical protein